MIFKGKEIEFPAIAKISFFKVIETLEKQAKDKDKNVARFAKELLEESNQLPELKDGFEDRKFLEKHRSITNKLSRVLFPDALLTNEIKGLIPPFDFEPFYVSTRFQNILDNAGGDFKFEFKDFNSDLLYIYGASTILGAYHKYQIKSGGPGSIEIEDKKAKMTRVYHMAFNADLMEMVPTKDAPEITEEDYKALMDDFYNVDLWKKKFPPNSYIMRGIGIANLMDVTIDRSLSSITSNMLHKTEDSIDKITQNMRNLFGISDLEGGFVAFDNNAFHNAKKPHEKAMNSFLLGDDIQLSCEDDTMCSFSHKVLIIDKKPLVITDVDKFHENSNTPFSKKLKKHKIVGSYIIAPLINEGELLGFMELASPRKYELNGGSIAYLEQILPIFAMAISRFKREAQNLREAIIQQECTTIHPSVKWRFDEEADKFMGAQFRNEQPVFDDIVFSDVYPLYGQLDIKGSSTKRNEAIKADLLKQVKGIRKVLTGALKVKPMPVYEQLLYRLDVFKDEVRMNMSSGSEQRIQNFMNREIKPVLDQLKSEGGDMAQLVDKYCAMLNPELGTVYEQRRKFDTSVNILNQTLASMLDEKQVEAQKMFPHYFERYKTDGVEYNMYIGQSISGKQKFDHVFLDNLRLWQLIVTCELENRFKKLNKELETPLEIASLLLAYSSPLSVHFRMDEKRFDVEGAYNARYEIVKKRVDKAHIKGTNERITAPGKIAIIYTSEEDARDYKDYVEFLESKGYLKEGSLETLELEDLQGITGLKALRVEVNYDEKDINSEFFVDKILEGIKGN
jgi:hypothetical protein